MKKQINELLLSENIGKSILKRQYEHINKNILIGELKL
jgi:hypothetical protein